MIPHYLKTSNSAAQTGVDRREPEGTGRPRIPKVVFLCRLHYAAILMSSLKLEHQLLLSLSRCELTSAEHRAISARAGAADWSTIFDLARRGGVAGMVSRHLQGLPVPTEIALRFVLDHLLTERRNRIIMAESLSLCAEAEEQGLTLIPLKGADLNLSRPYNDPGLRWMCDLDLLTSRHQVEALEGFLRERGYEEHGDRESYLRYYHHLGYQRQIGREQVSLELHFTALHVMYGDPRADARLIERARVEEVQVPGPGDSSASRTGQGRKIRRLHPEDATLSVLLHFAEHRFRGQLKWLVDIAELARHRETHLDWGEILEAARTLGARRAALHALGLARVLLGAPIPDLPHRSRLAPLLGRLSTAAAVVESEEQPCWGRRALINLLSFDAPLPGLSYLLHKGAELAEGHLHLRLPGLFRRSNLLGPYR